MIFHKTRSSSRDSSGRCRRNQDLEVEARKLRKWFSQSNIASWVIVKRRLGRRSGGSVYRVTQKCHFPNIITDISISRTGSTKTVFQHNFSFFRFDSRRLQEFINSSNRLKFVFISFQSKRRDLFVSLDHRV